MDERRRARHEVHLRADGPFLEPDRQVIRWTQTMTREDLLGLAGTYSAVITMEPPERQEYLAAMSRYLESHEIPHSQGTVEVPMRCLCWRTSRR